MTVYHIVLFRLKQSLTTEQITEWQNDSQALVDQVPGLVSIKVNVSLAMSVPRAKGFDFGLVAVLESPEHVEGYATHPAHMESMKSRFDLCEDMLAYDLEF